MIAVSRNQHATALVIGTTGFLFVGPSGAGKTTSAMACLSQARARGQYAALVGDDQVMIRKTSGLLIAETIDTIAGWAEIRGAGLVDVPAIAAAVMDFAVLPVDGATSERLPPEGEQFLMEGIGALPLLRSPSPSAEILDRLFRIAGIPA